MKKIGIMTWYQYKNYGTTLQATALIQVVKSMGYECEGINYISLNHGKIPFIKKVITPSLLIKGIKKKIKSFIYKSEFDYEKEFNYNNFLDKYVNMGPKTQTSSKLFQLNNIYDAFICGSDQIWTPNAFDSKYFLDFVQDKNKKIAYAPSFGVTEILDYDIKKEVGKLVKEIGFISVREIQASNMLKKYYDIDSKVVIDPTLLLDKKGWSKYFVKNMNYLNDTIVCYFLGDNEKNWKIVDKISKILDLNIYVIPVFSKDYHRGYNILKGVGPSEFLTALNEAKLVCTDSFHGTIFSINFNTNFLVFNRFSDKNPKSQNSRINNILTLLNLNNRLCNKLNLSLVNESIDWDKVNFKLSELKKDSLYFLQSSLDTSTSKIKKECKLITNTCSGCGACKNICPVNAINIEMKDGFYKAFINQSKCINCGLCNRICSFNGDSGKALLEGKLYEAKSNNIKILKTSTSGGIAYELSYFFNKNYGDVYACEYDYQNNHAKHTLVKFNNVEKLKKFQGSKYLQSDFFGNLNDVIVSKKCLVIGTPCQIAGLHNLLEIKGIRENFILIDLICHGVPNYNLWLKYLKEKDMLDVLDDVKFRDPLKGWNKLTISLRRKNNNFSKKELKDDFYSFFDAQNCYTDACYECNYRNSSKADIRLGDYWGTKLNPKEVKYGISMVTIFTENGKKIINEIFKEDRIYLKEKNIEDYIIGQGISNPTKPTYYYSLIDELNNENLTLKQIRNKYFKLEYINKKIAIVYGKLKRK